MKLEENFKKFRKNYEMTKKIGERLRKFLLHLTFNLGKAYRKFVEFQN